MRLLFACLFLSLAAASASGQGREVHAVIAGEQAAPSYPWMTALLQSRHADPYQGLFCGGTLVAPDWVLTAAHCVAGRWPSEVDVLAGTASLRRGEGQRRTVDAIVVHPGYVPPRRMGSGAGAPAADDRPVEFDNDIALLHLSAPLPGLQPVDLPGQEFGALQVKDGSTALLLGWGAMDFDNGTRTGGNYPLDLRQVLLPLASAASCASVMGAGEVTANMLCAGDARGGSDSCLRDSGGPLAVRSAEPGRWRQIAIVSWGLGCSLPGYYGVYTRLGNYAQWISDQVCDPADLPPAPVLAAPRKGLGAVTLEWSGGGAGARYRVYYRPALSGGAIRHLDAGPAHRLTSAVPRGIPFQFAVQAYRGPCLGGYSVIGTFML